jgi:MoaA/NifB/PqqE/SkfB family radical SAM enzyme
MIDFTAENFIPSRPIYRKHNKPTGRGWLFLGENGGPCDKACKFCYYAYQPDLVFYDLDTIFMIINRFRWVYGLDSCDISGGEPTIYPYLHKVVEHCADIGLKPTIITHAQNCTEKKVRQIEDAGLDDWLISLHGIGDNHDKAVVSKRGDGTGGFERLSNALGHMKRPTRFNSTLQIHNYDVLPQIAQWLSDNQEPTAWNLIQFNPFNAWDGKETIDFQVPMSKLGTKLAKAIEIAENAGFEVNVRYFPFCVAAQYGFEKNCINYYQTQYDPWEWGLEATQRRRKQEILRHGGSVKTRRLICDTIRDNRMNEKCKTCRFSSICEGPTK